MATIENLLICFSKQADFEDALNAGDVAETSIVFVKDEKVIWTHGVYFGSLEALSDYYDKGEIDDKIEELKALIEETADTKQDKLTAGTGIEIGSDGTIRVTLDTTIAKVVSTLPTVPDEEDKNKIFLVPADEMVTSNIYKEYLYISATESWEQLGEYKADIDLSDYLKKEDAAATYATKEEVDNAQKTADAATTAAANAQTTANNAQASATEALTAANQAAKDADAVKELAEQAQSDAAEAKELAEEALAAAQAAQSTADAAQSTANSAQSTANQAESDASSAQSAASAAQSAADAAQAAADKAQSAVDDLASQLSALQTTVNNLQSSISELGDIYLKLTGGTLTGNLVVGSTTVQTGTSGIKLPSGVTIY